MAIRSIYCEPHTDQSIDLTPMLDVVFIMLIFFIVTAVFIKEQGLNISSSDSSSNPSPDKPILISIRDNDAILLNHKPVDIRRLVPNFVQLHAQDPKKKLVIAAAPQSTTYVLVTVMDAARQAGIEDIGFAN